MPFCNLQEPVLHLCPVWLACELSLLPAVRRTDFTHRPDCSIGRAAYRQRLETVENHHRRRVAFPPIWPYGQTPERPVFIGLRLNRHCPYDIWFLWTPVVVSRLRACFLNSPLTAFKKLARWSPLPYWHPRVVSRISSAGSFAL